MDSRRLARMMTPVQRVTLLLLRALDGQPVKGKLKLQKEVFAVSRNNERLAESLEYEPAPMGPFSESLEWNTDQLLSVGLVDDSNSTYNLTENGDEIAQILEQDASKDELQIVADMKELMNDLTDDELLAFVYFTASDMTSESEKLAGLLPKRERLALSLFRKGKVGLEVGAKIAGLDVGEFIAMLREDGIRVFSE